MGDASVVDAVVGAGVVPLAVSDDLETVSGVGGEGTPVQGSGSLRPRLKVPVLWRSYQNNWFSVISSMLGHAEAKKAVDIVAPEFDHGRPGLQVEGVEAGQEGEEDEEGLGVDHVEAGRAGPGWECLGVMSVLPAGQSDQH